MFDVKIVAHEIAMEAAKAYVQSNLPEYKERGTAGYAEDMARKYAEAYPVARKTLDKYYDQAKISLMK